MTYQIVKEKGKFCIYDSDGKEVESYPTRREAVKKLKQLMDEEAKEPTDSAAEEEAE